MTLARRLRLLEEATPPARPTKALPTDPAAFARGLLAGDFAVEDIDRADPNQTGWLARLNAFLVTLSPDHQAWLRRERERDPRAYPGDLVLPATDKVILTALDDVMRRG